MMRSSVRLDDIHNGLLQLLLAEAAPHASRQGEKGKPEESHSNGNADRGKQGAGEHGHQSKAGEKKQRHRTP